MNALDRQEIFGAHGLCWEEVHEPDHSTWWFDSGELCAHPEWHGQVRRV